MSHNYSYRRQPLDSSLRSDPGSYSSSGHPHTSPDHDFNRAPQESYSSSHQSSSSSYSRVHRWSQEGAFSVLSSCGLEPSDLALLAEMPEDALTVESLPQVLKQIKGKRGTVKPYLQGSPSPSSSSPSSCAPSSAHRPAASPSISDWDHPRSHMLQYPTDQAKPSRLPSELDRWGNPIALSCVKAQPSSSSSSSSSYVVDFHHRAGPSDYGKTSRDPSPVSSQNYFHKSGTPEFVKPGRSSHLVPSQDFHHRPGASRLSETSRNAAPDSTKDYYHRPGPPEYGKTVRDVGPASSQNQPSFSSAGRDQTTRPSHPGPDGYTLPPPAQESHPRPSFGCSRSETSSARSNSSQPAASMPSRRNALDFHGATPPMYPHSCSLCAITVMSEKVWLKHINGPHHADGQLNLLQRFPSWDCRMETVERADNQPEQQREEEKPAKKPQTADQNSNPPQPNTKTQKKISEKSKVVCVKFPAHAVDEAYLRKLAEPFGKIVKILMFPSLAFVELGSMDQAKDLVKFHTNYPPTVNGELMEFRISNTFNFLQSSSVVSFFPAPSGENGQSDLISIVKRFGSPLFTLFLPSRAFVEMKDATEAQKIVNYYSSNNLRINDDLVKVSFSGEYKSLMRVPSAKRYEEETTTTTKTTKSSSREREERRMESKRRRSRTRSRSRSKEKSSTEKKSRTRSKSKEKSDRGKTRDRSSREGRTRTRSKSKEKSTKERWTRSRSREKASRVSSRSGDGSSRDEKTRTRAKSKEKITNGRKSASREKSEERHSKERRSRSKSRSREKTVVLEKTETSVSTESSSDPHPVRDTPEAAEEEHTKEEAESSDDESDIEGMEVIGEDGESLQDEEMETVDEANEDGEEEEEEEEKEERPAERTDSPEEDQEDRNHEQQEEEEEERENPLKEAEGEEEISVKEEEELKQTLLEEDKMERGFPIDLDSCITLDELEEDDSDDGDVERRNERKSHSSRVLYFTNVPLGVFTDAEFIQLVRGYGTAVLFFRVPGRQTGFIEMSSSAEAQRVRDALTARPLRVHGCRIHVEISNRYPRLITGWPVESIENLKAEKDSESRSRGSRRSERLSKTSDRDESSRRSGGRKSSSRGSQERESKTSPRSSEKKSPEKKPERLSRKTPENESTNETTPENESTNETTPEKESTNKTTPENESTNETTPEKESTNETTPEKESASRLTAEESQDERSLEKESKQSSRTDPEKETTQTNLKTSAEMNPASDQSPEKESSETRTCKRRGTREDESVPEKKIKKESEDEETRKNDAEAPEEEKMEIQERGEDLKSTDQPDCTGGPPRPQTEQKPADQLEDFQIKEEQQSKPVSGAKELQKPLKPVGTEFVRPVVGYFCNLCHVIYADEDEAKQQHCSSEEHYRKYQEKTGKDPRVI